MLIATKVKLDKVPTNPKVVTFKSGHSNPNKNYYPKFFTTKYTRFKGALQEGGTYRILAKVDCDKDADGNNILKSRGFLNEAKLCNAEGDEQDLGKALLLNVYIKEIYDEQIITGNTEFDKDIETIRRIKVGDEKTNVYLGWYNAPVEYNFAKGDQVDIVVRLMNKTFELPDGTLEMYNDKPAYFTELEFIRIERIIS